MSMDSRGPPLRVWLLSLVLVAILGAVGLAIAISLDDPWSLLAGLEQGTDEALSRVCAQGHRCLS